MTTKGIEALFIGTRNWGKTVKLWQELGFEIEFETDHGSGLLRHPAGGPYLFVAEQPEGEAVEIKPIVTVEDASVFTPPSTATVEEDFTARHWGVVEMTLRDADGHAISLQAPVPEGVEVPPGH
jgi:hypothetical protein